uniref:alpha-glucosidase n=1 Tax=Syphacia muris TaxID=451379 RepID=A0A0N5ANX6_9BILA
MMDDVKLPLSADTKTAEAYTSEGDSKLIIQKKELPQMELVQPVIGLTKEQLEKYRNDPFWKPFRMFMFVLFWLIWVAMFVGAVLIVVFSPKCAIEKDVQWWEAKVSYQIFTSSFRDSDRDGVGDFKGIAEKLEEIRKIGVQNVWATPVIATDKDDFDPYEVSDLMQVDERFGDIESLKYLITEVHRFNMHFVMDFPISTTSRKHTWFVKASKGDEVFKDYYLWKKTTEVETDSRFKTMNGSAESYMTYNEKLPIVNLQNKDVRIAVANAAKKYLDLGVDGFYIPLVNQVCKTDQNLSSAHLVSEALKYLKNEIENYTGSFKERQGKDVVIFTSMTDLNQLDGISDYAKNNNFSFVHYVIDDSMKKLSKVSWLYNDSCTDTGISQCVYSKLKQSMENFKGKNLPYFWQFTDYRVSRLSSRFNQQIGNLLTFMELTLPGGIEIYYGQEIGMPNADEKTGQFTGLMQWDGSEKTGFTEEAKMDLFFGRTADYKLTNYKVLLFQIYYNSWKN